MSTFQTLCGANITELEGLAMQEPSCWICSDLERCPYQDCYDYWAEKELAERMKAEAEAQLDMFESEVE